MAQIPKLMARLQFGLQFNTVPRRPGKPIRDVGPAWTDRDSDDPSC